MTHCWNCDVDLEDNPPTVGTAGEPWCADCGAYYPQAEVVKR